MKVLGLDVGRRRTGAAFLDESTGVPLALDTIHHADIDELVSAIEKLWNDRQLELIVIGLPLLPSGSEGEQAEYVHDVVRMLEEKKFRVVFLDERYTTDRAAVSDGDAKAALSLLQMYQERAK